MDFIELTLQEYEHEMRATRNVLECVPDEHWGWKPHPKSMSLGMLASHIAESQRWAEDVMTKDELVLDFASFRPYEAKNRMEMLAKFDRLALLAAKSMAGVSNERLAAQWRLKSPDGQVLLQKSRLAILRDFVINHTIHHRGQLTVYLRLKDVPLPQVYGPTADDTAMKG